MSGGTDNREYPKFVMRALENVPELLEWPWIHDYSNVIANSKFVSGVIPSDMRLPAPVNLILTVMREASQRPEVMFVFADAAAARRYPELSKKGLSDRDRTILNLYTDYLKHKYGTNPNPVREMLLVLQGLAIGDYAGVADPRLRSALLAQGGVCDDDGVDYSI